MRRGQSGVAVWEPCAVVFLMGRKKRVESNLSQSDDHTNGLEQLELLNEVGRQRTNSTLLGLLSGGAHRTAAVM